MSFMEYLHEKSHVQQPRILMFFIPMVCLSYVAYNWFQALRR